MPMLLILYKLKYVGKITLEASHVMKETHIITSNYSIYSLNTICILLYTFRIIYTSYKYLEYFV